MSKPWSTIKRKKDMPKSILAVADELVNEKRAKEYGDFRLNSIRAMGAYEALRGDNCIKTSRDFALLMVLFKLGRECTIHKRDNLIDACGYLKLLDELNGSI